MSDRAAIFLPFLAALFTITAINDSGSGNGLVPLAPSKEAQESHLSDKYYEALTKITVKEYIRARELLEEALRDPLISDIQADDNDVRPHLRELRFLCLKNLGEVYLKLGSEHNGNAMRCFLEATELDGDHVVLWNQLGTLSCSMGSLSRARWAFEQGLRVSPTNSICMEKLMEVLIAIGDEVPCIEIANRLLNKWPGHSRALHVRRTIEGNGLEPSGFDKLEPKHPRLNFGRMSDIQCNPEKRISQDIHLQLTEATWSALVEKTADAFKTIDVPYLQRIIVYIDNSTSNNTSKEDSSVPGKGGPSHESCCTRAGRVGSQKKGKGKVGSAKDADAFIRALEQFTLKEMSLNKESDCSSPLPDVSWYTPEIEAIDVKQFIGLIPENCTASHLACLLLEEIADLDLPFGDYFIKLPELERTVRQWHRFWTPRCHLYLAEVCLDLASLPGNEMRREEFLFNSNHHICMFKADFISNGGTKLDITSHWARFYWICGFLSLSEGDKERAEADFNHAISYMRGSIFLPNCKNEKWLTVERITCEIYSIHLENLLGKDNKGLEKLSYSQRVNVLSPLLLSNKVVKRDPYAVAKEIFALDLLISACEKEETLNLKVHLDSQTRKLQLLTSLAGLNLTSVGVSDIREISNSNQFEQIIAVIRDISKSMGLVKSFTSKSNLSIGQEVVTSLAGTIAEAQSLLLTVLCSSLKSIMAKPTFTNLSLEPQDIESICLVDCASSFCKLQHLDPSVSLEEQVKLIVLVHDLLAECGLCCAGKGDNGEEGTFLKFAINHLLTLDGKLKTLHTTGGIGEAACSDELTNAGFEESNIESALIQCIFCLYGLVVDPDSTNEALVKHKNTGQGNYNTKEHCADLFQYILPYAKQFPRSGLVKLRNALRAIHKHFLHPPSEVLSSNVIDKFLNGPDSCEKQLLEIYESNGGREAVMKILFPDSCRSDALEMLSSPSSEPYLEVYRNIFYFIARVEDTSAVEKYAGFVLQKEGEDFVEQNANLLKYDLLYNPLRFESWQKLANIYDEEVDLLLNDGSKCMSSSEWRKHTTLHQRVQDGRRLSRRCLLMSLNLASTSLDESHTNELLALGYYDILHNALPVYDQRFLVPTKNATWLEFCQSSMKHFQKAFELRPEWLHALYLGKLCEKLGHPSAEAFWYYLKARELNAAAVEPFYRLHASRLKLLYGSQNAKQSYVIQIVAAYSYDESTKEAVRAMFGLEKDHLIPSKCNDKIVDLSNLDLASVEEAWSVLYNDCLLALGSCAQGELKHFHKAKFKIAQGLHRRGDVGDLERARDELSFCFKSARSSFTVNIWEINAVAKKRWRKDVGVSGKISLRPSLSESSRKFVTCIRKYLLLYLDLLERTGDLCTLEHACTYLCTDNKFSACIGDLVPVCFGKYIQALASAVRDAQDDTSVKQHLGKLFAALMKNSSAWSEISSLPEVNFTDLSEANIIGYILRYIQILERELQLDQLESLNEQIKKCNNLTFCNNLTELTMHASFSWCWCLLMELASISAVPETAMPNDNQITLSRNDIMLYVDLHPDELLMSSPNGATASRYLDMSWSETLSRISNLQIRKAPEEKMEAAVNLLRSSYNFYRHDIYGTLPSGIKLYAVLAPPSVSSTEEQVEEPVDGVGNIDLSVPDKLLLWAYALVSGKFCNISAVVKYCEGKKLRRKKGVRANSCASPFSPPRLVASSAVTNTTGIDRAGSMDPAHNVLPPDTSGGASTSGVNQ